MNKYRIFIRTIQVMVLASLRTFGGDPVVIPSNTVAGIDGALWIGLAAQGVTSVRTNPAAVRSAEGVSALFSVTPTPFGLSPLTRYDGILQWRTGTTGIGTSVTSSGFTLFREFAGTVHFSTEGNRDLRLGIALTVDHAAIAGYGSRAALLLDGGILWQYQPGLMFGLVVHNINGGHWEGEDDRPREIGAGAAVHVTESLCLLADLVKDLRYRKEVRCALRFLPVTGIQLEAGMEGNRMLSAAITLQWNDVNCSISTSRHAVLGYSTALSMMMDLR